jgi:NADH-quinone oxidoreductase subunit J
MTINLILLAALAVFSLWTVMTARLMRSVIGLALTSVVLSVILFRLNAPFAGVFELSVCAGLISVFFIIVIGFTKPVTDDALHALVKSRRLRYLALPILALIIGLAVWHAAKSPVIAMAAQATSDTPVLLWGLRHADLIGQIIVLLAGALGVAAFFKEHKK